MNQEQIIILSVGIALIFLLVGLIIFISFNSKNKAKIIELNNQIDKYLNDLERFKPILDVEEQVGVVKSELDFLNIEFSNLKGNYHEKREIFKKLSEEVQLYESDIEFFDYGVYKPQFNFDDSETYKKNIKENIAQQKELIKQKKAAICEVPWTVDGSVRKGEVMTNRNIRMTLRAFNGECDSLMTKVKWNNVNKIEERIRKADKALQKMNASNRIYITEDYLQLKLNQLHLTYEMENKKQEEKEEQRRIREEMREEERAKREIEQAQKEAEKEESRYIRALEKARKDVQKATGDKVSKLNEQILMLTKQLENAQVEKARAISRAQITRSGHVYIISNIGSFGEKVYKIGMTRRLDPMDRVKELGDASVPFRFDVHAIIYSDNAPDLEAKLHQAFDKKRVNLVNQRKEYFRVSLDEIESIVKESLSAEITFTKAAEAQEYRETIALLDEMESKVHDAEEFVSQKYPDNLFE
ncbi:MAG: DUF4041 domain-containing protein [Balneola sp.]